MSTQTALEYALRGYHFCQVDRDELVRAYRVAGESAPAQLRERVFMELSGGDIAAMPTAAEWRESLEAREAKLVEAREVLGLPARHGSEWLRSELEGLES